MLVLDAGDYSMGTAFSAATRETGGELHLMGLMGYDATTFGNHEFDLGPAGLGKSIGVAAKAGRIPAVLAANTSFTGNDPTLADLQRLARKGAIRRYTVIERGGMRFGMFGVLGKEAMIYTSGGATTFADPIESAKEVVKILRETEKVDVVIALSHGGVEKGQGRALRRRRGRASGQGRAGHRRGDRRPQPHRAATRRSSSTAARRWSRPGKESRNLGELVITLDGDKLTVDSYRLHPIDDTIARRPGHRRRDRTAQEVGHRGRVRVARLSASISRWPSRRATCPTPSPTSPPARCWPTSSPTRFAKRPQADIGFTANGMMRARLSRGKTGVQTVYDVFAVAPLGSGVVDPTPGSTLVTGYFTGQDLKNLLEFFLVDSPAHPGEYFPRASGMRFRYDPSRPKFDAVTAIELGDLDRGYKAIDISGKDARLYSLTCPLMLAPIIVAIPKYTKGKLALVPKNKDGEPLTSKVEALEMPPDSNSPYLLPPPGTTDAASVATGGARTPAARSRSGRRSWITCAACRSRARANCR